MQKHVNLVDLVKSFPTNIFLQNLASIQKRTSPIKFAHLAEKSENGSISNLSTKVAETEWRYRSSEMPSGGGNGSTPSTVSTGLGPFGNMLLKPFGWSGGVFERLISLFHLRPASPPDKPADKEVYKEVINSIEGPLSVQTAAAKIIEARGVLSCDPPDEEPAQKLEEVVQAIKVFQNAIDEALKIGSTSKATQRGKVRQAGPGLAASESIDDQCAREVKDKLLNKPDNLTSEDIECIEELLSKSWRSVEYLQDKNALLTVRQESLLARECVVQDDFNELQNPGETSESGNGSFDYNDVTPPRRTQKRSAKLSARWEQLLSKDNIKAMIEQDQKRIAEEAAAAEAVRERVSDEPQRKKADPNWKLEQRGRLLWTDSVMPYCFSRSFSDRCRRTVQQVLLDTEKDLPSKCLEFQEVNLSEEVYIDRLCTSNI